MKCIECGYKFEKDDFFFDIDEKVLCEVCFDDYLEELKNKAMVEYSPFWNDVDMERKY